jgi:hypothetical protein
MAVSLQSKARDSKAISAITTHLAGRRFGGTEDDTTAAVDWAFIMDLIRLICWMCVT